MSEHERYERLRVGFGLMTLIAIWELAVIVVLLTR